MLDVFIGRKFLWSLGQTLPRAWVIRMRHVWDFADQRQKALCIHCHGQLSRLKTNKDHVPSKSLLDSPFPDNLPVIVVCAACNSSFSFDEEYTAAFLSAVLSGTVDPDYQVTVTGARILARNAKLRGAIARTQREYRTMGGETRVFWTPEIDRIRRVAIKNARGHIFYETSDPYFAEPAYVWCRPVESLSAAERKEFEGVGPEDGFAAWPEVGSRLMTRLATGDDFADGWITVQDEVYRYSIRHGDTVVIRSVVRDYLATEVCWVER